MTDHATAHRTRIDLPDDVQPPYSVFVNGVRQRPGCHYEHLGRALYFTRELKQEGTPPSDWRARLQAFSRSNAPARALWKG
jgi:hypothetical protein